MLMRICIQVGDAAHHQPAGHVLVGWLGLEGREAGFGDFGQH